MNGLYIKKKFNDRGLHISDSDADALAIIINNAELLSGIDGVRALSGFMDFVVSERLEKLLGEQDA